MHAAARALALVTLLCPALAGAGSTLKADRLSVNGLEVRQLSCTLEKADFFALMTVVGALAKQKDALDACAPAGAAFRVEWQWAKGKAKGAKVAQSSKAGANKCVAAAVLKTSAATDGSCAGTILVGEAKAAGKAADALK
ncbi:MAG TPA: hypothetical protein VGQ83_00020 [Polyangia bacterium]|jgi:hypothetical protein